MVKVIRKSKINYYQCEECEFVYKDRMLAKKCQKLSTSLWLVAESQISLWLWKVSEHAQEPPFSTG